MRSRAAVSILVAVVLTALAPSASAARHPHRKPGKPLTVMTRNLYLGADINRPIVAALTEAARPGHTAQSVLEASGQRHPRDSGHRRPDELQRPGKAAGERSQTTSPDLVGLQEVALWRHGPLDTDPSLIAVPNATDRRLRLPRILLDGAAQAGPALQGGRACGTRADVEAPSFTGSLQRSERPTRGTCGSPCAT